MEYRNALVTGASSGLGRGLAAWFARKGVRVFAAARRMEQLEALRAEEPSSNIEAVELDVSNAKRTLDRIQVLDRECGGLDLVIANAGVGFDTSGRKIRWEHVEKTIDVNVKGAAATLVAALPGMVERKRGHLVGISSIAAFRGLPRTAAYCASKAFLSTFLEGLRIDLRGTGVSVTTIYPGYVKSEMTDRNKGRMPFLLETQDAVERMGKAITREERTFVFPWQMSLVSKPMRVLPPSIFDAIVARGR